MRQMQKNSFLPNLLRRSFRQVVLFCALVAVTTTTHAQRVPQEPRCHGYRYAFIQEVGTVVQFYACKRILEPSSRPVDCQMLGEIETAEVRKKLKSKAYSYVAGYSLGVLCGMAGYIAAKVSAPVGGAVAAYNYGAQTLSVGEMQEEVLTHQRELGQMPFAQHHYQSAGRGLCSYLTKGSKSLFASGTNQAVDHIASMRMEAEAMHADSKLIWAAPASKRAEMFATYKKNIRLRQERRARAMTRATNIATEIAEYAMSNELTDIPFGTTGELAIVPANSCIPTVDLIVAAESLRSFPRRVDEVLKMLEGE